jgi:hypothetical protein
MFIILVYGSNIYKFIRTIGRSYVQVDLYKHKQPYTYIYLHAFNKYICTDIYETSYTIFCTDNDYKKVNRKMQNTIQEKR